MTTHTTAGREQWLAARRELLEAEKELTRRSDDVARQRQQLLDQMNGAFDGRAEVVSRRPTRRLVGRTIEQLQLQAQRRERRSKFVGGIRNERALNRKCLIQAGQEPIEFGHQGFDLLRQVVGGQRRRRSAG